MVANAISNDVKILEGLFITFNKKFFGDKLPIPTITIQTKGKNQAYGWITVNDLWVTKENTKHKEINLSAEHMNRPFKMICATMLHEMVHLYNMEHQVQDCSRGGTYHNKKFRDAGEKIGLKILCEPKYGWSHTSIEDDTELGKYIASLKSDYAFKYRIDVFELEEGKKKKGSNSIKYICPVCEQSVRATKKVNIICADCEILMMPEK